MLLQNRHWKQIGITTTQGAYDHMFPETEAALDNMERMLRALRNAAVELVAFDDEITIFLMQILYQSTSAVITLSQGNITEDLRKKIDLFKWLLHFLRSRWRVASRWTRDPVWFQQLIQINQISI
jgi:hypothetical protein